MQPTSALGSTTVAQRPLRRLTPPPHQPRPTNRRYRSLRCSECRVAYPRRHETDYIFEFWTAFGWTLPTCGIYLVYVVYQLVRRSHDHNLRCSKLLGRVASPPRSSRSGLLRSPSSCSTATSSGTTRRGPGRENELAFIYARLGTPVEHTDPSRLHQAENYVGRIRGVGCHAWCVHAFLALQRHGRREPPLRHQLGGERLARAGRTERHPGVSITGVQPKAVDHARDPRRAGDRLGAPSRLPGRDRSPGPLNGSIARG